MPEPNHRPRRLRVLCLVLTEVDGAACSGALDEPDLDIETYIDVRAFCAAMESPADLLLIAEEHLRGDEAIAVERFLTEQEEWSLVPLILLTRTIDLYLILTH
jgi:hypothetical protein